MDKKLLFKMLAIGLMSILLLIPLAMIEDQIKARSSRQEEVKQNIANSAAGMQTLSGPVIALRYHQAVEPEVSKDPETGRITRTPRYVVKTRHLAPETLNIIGEAKVETRNRGIYQARLFHLNLATEGRFIVEPLMGGNAESGISNVEATLVLGLSDPRGVDSDPEVTINGKRLRFTTPGGKSKAETGLDMSQLVIPLGAIDPTQTSTFNFNFPLQLTGSERFAIAPSGEANSIQLKSDWRHPNFGGRFLPRERQVGADGFSAHWEISHLARNFDATLNPNSGEVLSIDFIDPVNVYLQSERAVKYGILFIALTFAGFFLTEILRRSPIHPMQYLLVGLALAIFFLLLIALSEHLSFFVSYGIASTACIALIGTYLAGALGGARPGLAFAGGLTGLYGVLYGVLLSEDNALLMGSVLLFLALGATMLATRRLNWYQIGNSIAPRSGE